MTDFTGLFSTASFPTDLAKKSFSATIARYMPNGNTPLFALTSESAREVALQYQHSFWTKTMIFPNATLDAAVSGASATTFTVVSTSTLLPNMVLRSAETGEHILIDSIISSTKFTCQRGVGTVAAGAISNATALYKVGTAFEQGSVRPQALNIQPVQVTNYTQIFRNSWAVSRTVKATMMAAGNANIAESRQDAGAFHASDIESSIIFGQRSTGTRNGQPFHTMNGLIAFLNDTSLYPAIYGGSVNVTAAGGTTTFAQLETALDPVFNQNTDPKTGNMRYLFVGGKARVVINNIGRIMGTYQIRSGETSFGLQFEEFKISRGTFRIVEHPLFNSNSTWAKYALAVDMPNLALAYMNGSDTMHEPFGLGQGGDNGIDAEGGTLTTECTLLHKNIPACALVTGLTAAA